MSDEAITSRLAAGTIINKENINEVVRAILSGATLTVTSAALIGYTRHFQHKDWIDFVDPVQAGGDNGFNDRFHKLESEFDFIAAAISSLDNAVTALQSAPLAIGITMVRFVIHVQTNNPPAIPTPSGFLTSETLFFAYPDFFDMPTITLAQMLADAQAHPQAPSTFFGFIVSASEDGKVTVIDKSDKGVVIGATGIGIAKKGGWGLR